MLKFLSSWRRQNSLDDRKYLPDQDSLLMAELVVGEVAAIVATFEMEKVIYFHVE